MTSLSAAQLTTSAHPRRGARLWRQLHKRPSLAVGTLILLWFTACIVFAPIIAPYDPNAVDTRREARNQPPSAAHWFGTDELGRDVFSRVVYGARVSIPAAVVVVASVFLIGTTLGAVAGYFDGWISAAVMRVADVTLAFPGLVLALAIAAILGPSLTNMLITACVVLWPVYARLMRAQVLTLRGQEFVLAARAQGMHEMRVLWRHVVPNALTPVLITAALDIGSILLLLAALSFFGLGVDVNTPEWGAMVAAGQRKFLYWWLAAFPGLAIFLVILGVNLVVEGLRGWLDPRSQ
jgi:peptide/nickel transport system permease protein